MGERSFPWPRDSWGTAPTDRQSDQTGIEGPLAAALRRPRTPAGVAEAILGFIFRRSVAGAVKLYSERLPLKYLLSDHGICLGVDLKRCSYLFLVSPQGWIFRRRPVGDTVVEDLDYEIPAIVETLRSEEGHREAS